MSIFSAILQAIVQGLTEFLPVSSSGHLSLVQHFTGVSAENATFLTAVMHLGTLVAVFIAFWGTLSKLIVEFFLLLRDLFTGRFKWSAMSGYRRMILMLFIALIPLLLVYPFKDKYDALVSQGNLFFLGACFLLTSLVLYLSEKCPRGKKGPKQMTAGNAVTVGVAQCVAILPGVSRSGSTLAASMMCGMTKKFAVEFSFILGIPAILGGGLVEVKDAVSAGLQIELLPVIVAFVVSAVTGFFAIKMVAWLIKSDKFKVFAIYTLAVGLFTIGTGVVETFFLK